MNNKSFLAQCICAIIFLSIFSSCDSISNQVKEMEKYIMLAHSKVNNIEEDNSSSNTNINNLFTSEAILKKVRSLIQDGAKLDSIIYIGHNWFKVKYDLIDYAWNSGEENSYDAFLYWKIKKEDNKFKLDDVAYAYSQCTSYIKDLPYGDRIKFWFKAIKYNDVQPYFQGNLCKVKNGDKYGFINIEGMEILPCKYDDVAFVKGDLLKIDDNYKRFLLVYDVSQDSLLRVKSNNKYGLLEFDGKEIVPCKYDDLALFDNNSCVKAKSDNKYGLLIFDGKEIVPCKYDDLTLFNYSLIKTEIDNKYGLLEFDGKEIVPCKYDDLTLLDSNYDYLLKAKSDNKYGLIELEHADDYERPTIVKGKEILPCIFDCIELGGWEMLKVQRDYLWSYYTKDGTQETEFYEDIKYYNPMFAAKSNGKWGYLNKAGDTLIPFVLDYAGEPYEDGTAYVVYNGQSGELDLNTRRFSRTYDNSNSYNNSNSSYTKRKCRTCNGNGSTSVTVGGVYRGQTRCTDCGGLGYFIQ